MKPMIKIDFHKVKKVHFIGIGGIGMSALARMMCASGKEVSGSDRDETSIIEQLKAEGVRIAVGNDGENIPPDVDAVIYTIAIPEDNSELKRARSLNVPIISYPEMLGIVSRDKYTIAISGTHGKTTTTAMVGKILKDAGLDPTIIVGSLLKDGGTNFVGGKSEYFVVEACEYKRSFLHLNPNILVITNIDNDHLDYYKDLKDIQNTFQELAHKVPKDGFVVANPHDLSVVPALAGIGAKIVDYTAQEADGISLQVKGAHNVLNAEAALAVACATSLDISREVALKALRDFEGTWRRFEYKGKMETGAVLYDDYAHHPTEIKATLRAAREQFPDEKIIVAFQPHLYSRTKLLIDEFAGSFADADEVIVAPVYAAREEYIPGADSHTLAEKIKKHRVSSVSYEDTGSIVSHIKMCAKSGDIVFTMGAGDIYKISEKLLITHS